MSDDPTGSAQPRVNQDRLQKQLLLQMELMQHEAQLRNFTPLRDRLVASGQDADTMYRQIQSRRDHIVAELKKLMPPVRPKTARPPAIPWHQGLPLSSLVAPARFLPGSLGPWFGYSGTVQLASAQEGIQVFPPGSTGTIETLALDGKGGVFFTGDITPMPIPGHHHNPGTFVETEQYFWLQNWSYVIPFPAPVVNSKFTYSFKVLVQAATAQVAGSALGWSYVSVGETPNFTSQQELVVDTSVGFPFAMADLNPPNGLISGQLAVQRSFVVQGGHVPCVSVIIGFAAGLSRSGEVVFDEAQDCFILPVSDSGDEGVVGFRYDPLLTVATQP